MILKNSLLLFHVDVFDSSYQFKHIIECNSTHSDHDKDHGSLKNIH